MFFKENIWNKIINLGDVTFMFCIDMRLLNDALALVRGQMDGWMDRHTDFTDHIDIPDFVLDI